MSTHCLIDTTLSMSVLGGHIYDFNQEGEQWAPIQGENSWVMIGQKYQNSATTCMSFEWLEGSSPGDGITAEFKRHIMCCKPDVANPSLR
ncbi:hypothetical protein ACHAWF_016231 [Thalassiosira exigua]